MLQISVIIPVYNAAPFLEKAVRSALQFSEVKEVLLIEDASPDQSLKICRKLSVEDSRVKILRHHNNENRGAGASRNLGLNQASQEFIAFLDADDYYLPNRFDEEKKIFRNPAIEGVFGAIGTEFLSEKGKKEFEEKFKSLQLTTVNHHAEGKDIFYGLLGLDNQFGTFFHLNGLTIRKESQRKNNLFFNEQLRVHQDSDFIIKLAYACHLKSGNITEAIAIRGVHDDNRITKIKTYSEKYNQRQALLWNSIYDWSKNKNIKNNFRKHIWLKNKAYQLSTQKGIKKVLNFVSTFFTNPNILKTKYRFTYLNK